jgi:hypothetical protein
MFASAVHADPIPLAEVVLRFGVAVIASRRHVLAADPRIKSMISPFDFAIFHDKPLFCWCSSSRVFWILRRLRLSENRRRHFTLFELNAVAMPLIILLFVAIVGARLDDF